MTKLRLTMLAAAAIGAASIGGASAMPLSALTGEAQGLVHQARVVCNQYGTCWDTRNTRRTWRSSRHNRQRYAQPYYGQPYYGQPYYGYHQPRAGISFGPFGIYAR
jgi:hypothetical protein